MSVQKAVRFDSFMDAASEGWSLVAVNAPMEELSEALCRRTDVVEYERHVSAARLRGHPIIHIESARRRCFAVQLEGSPWSVLLRTVEWVEPGDAVAVRQLATELSQALNCTTLASVGAYSGAECRLFREGMEVARVDTDDPYLDFLDFCENQEFSLPGCFIGYDGRNATLFVQDIPLDCLLRVDRVVVRVDNQSE